ncbi:MAG: hypothetical protein HY648_11805 [Acidobacteria bacterium]|nr:hypothetical protein [Acidobacteriota bacterium]
MKNSTTTFRAILLLALAAAWPATAQAQRAIDAGIRASLKQNLDLSPSNSQQQTGEAPDAAAIAKRCADEMQKARSYVSLLVMRDRSDSTLAPIGYVALTWETEFLSPDRYRISQVGPDGAAANQYTVIGEDYYHPMVGLLDLNDFPDIPDLAKAVGAAKYIHILRQESPKSASVRTYRNRRYYVLEYQNLNPSQFGAVGEWAKTLPQVRFWIDADSGLLHKVGFAMAPGQKQAEATPSDIDESFAGYGSELQIEVPRVLVH